MKDKRSKSDNIRFKYIQKFIKGDEVLDIGSSEGNVNKLLRAKNPEKKIYTLDNSGRADFKVDLDHPRNINKKFDTIIAGEVIEHLESPIKFIQYCKSLLKKNGRLIITTPNASGIQYILNPGWCVYYTNYRGHTQAFTIDMLKRICSDNGLKLIYSDYVNAFWINNPLQIVSWLIKRIRPDMIVVVEKSEMFK